ncbi:hypothetical protein [Frankia sp. Cr2]|uniref:hypothetical protein n=1 Tax=Frankia sp. Cr2 TaxID=3073932 RepID=UPI002AD53D2F|nr:hypothetical protein [Frankia sp. Cr2]
MGALPTKNTYLAAQYARLRPRLDHARALVAIEHSILVAIFYIQIRLRRMPSALTTHHRFLFSPPGPRASGAVPAW